MIFQCGALFSQRADFIFQFDVGGRQSVFVFRIFGRMESKEHVGVISGECAYGYLESRRREQFECFCGNKTITSYENWKIGKFARGKKEMTKIRTSFAGR